MQKRSPPLLLCILAPSRAREHGLKRGYLLQKWLLTLASAFAQGLNGLPNQGRQGLLKQGLKGLLKQELKRLTKQELKGASRPYHAFWTRRFREVNGAWGRVGGRMGDA